MDTKLFLLAIIFVTSLLFTSCTEDFEKPEISNFELGINNSKIGVLDSDLHIQADVYAEAKVDEITVKINTDAEDGWEFDSTFTEFAGLKDPTFHKHIDISGEAATGTYNFYFIVADMEGQKTTFEDELELQEPDDNVAPVITVSSAPTNNQVFNNGESISISGSVSDDVYLGGLYIGLVREGQNLTDAEVNADNTITILHTHHFDSSTSHDFSSSITVGAAQDNDMTPDDITGAIAWQSANYYIVVKCKDNFGGNWTFSAHYPIVINY